MWGPNYDWIPDQDHGGVNMIALQKMVLQEDGDRILLFPAWPADWDLKFRVHASGGTTVEGELKDGQITDFNITPPDRHHDVETFIGHPATPAHRLGGLAAQHAGRRRQAGDDGDRDRFVDLMEYALGGDPADPTTPRGLQLVWNAPTTRMVMSYDRPTGLPDILYAVETSIDLEANDWEPLTAVPSTIDNGDGTETVSHELPAMPEAMFCRLSVALQP